MHIILFQLKILSKFSLHPNFKKSFTNIHVYLLVSHCSKTKIMKPVLSTLKKSGYDVMNYLDDIFIYGDTFAEFRDAALATVNLVLKLGLSINPEKSKLTPVKKIEYPGFLIDSVEMKMFLMDLET